MVARTWRRTLVSSFTVKHHTPTPPVLASLSLFVLSEGVSSDASVIGMGDCLVLHSLEDEYVSSMMGCHYIDAALRNWELF